ncbi:MAG: zf-HC2 domain-containing protein [Thermodesulfovibrionales bacterium]|nr:zf-HC2 domain-containing protein [Thermodesulfovibrionales bacterium]MDP3111513.1 zf-HC2 domain-containing protein [Thermodesulfovibrionales bacterium]
MNCSKTHKLISPYIDGELKASDREAFEAHIKSCRTCSIAVEEVRNQHNLFSYAKQFNAPYAFSTRVMANIAPEKAGGFSWTPLIIRFAEVVALLVIIFSGIISGGFLAGRLMPEKLSSVASSFSLDIFDSAPPDSLGGVYLAMTEVRHEK